MAIGSEIFGYKFELQDFKIYSYAGLLHGVKAIWAAGICLNRMGSTSVPPLCWHDRSSKVTTVLSYTDTGAHPMTHKTNNHIRPGPTSLRPLLWHHVDRKPAAR